MKPFPQAPSSLSAALSEVKIKLFTDSRGSPTISLLEVGLTKLTYYSSYSSFLGQMPATPHLQMHSLSSLHIVGMFMCHFWHNFDDPFYPNNSTYSTLPLMVYIYLPYLACLCTQLPIRKHVPFQPNMAWWIYVPIMAHSWTIFGTFVHSITYRNTRILSTKNDIAITVFDRFWLTTVLCHFWHGESMCQ